jgi:transposase
MASEVFYWRFDNRKQLAGYAGVTPSHFQSGPMCRDHGIRNAGNTKARTISWARVDVVSASRSKPLEGLVLQSRWQAPKIK